MLSCFLFSTYFDLEQTGKSFGRHYSILASNLLDRFDNDTRTHILIILIRLAIDHSLMTDAVVASELMNTITTLLDSIPAESIDNMVRIAIDSLSPS